MRYKGEFKKLSEYYEIQNYFKDIKRITKLGIIDVYILIHIKNQVDSFSELNSSIKVDRSLISRRISEMEREGLVKKYKIDSKNKIIVTATGSKLLEDSLHLYKKQLEKHNKIY